LASARLCSLRNGVKTPFACIVRWREIFPPRVTPVNALKRLVEELDPMLHERGRLAIVSVLAAADSLTFTDLRDALEMTDGNLSVHLQKLEDKGYVAIDKKFVGRRPQTTCRLSRAGKQAFTRYLNHLQAIVEQGREQAGAG
jgi:DNA-binding transcriptional ArsR family regulator